MSRNRTRDGNHGVPEGPEDFLYHLYRGSDLLQSDRVVEAKGELERALSLQPQDAKSQDLLAGVYFRLGLYPRAIEIWEDLAETAPRDPTLHVNLSLALFKTGQADEALRHVRLALDIQPDHSKAWGYMGLILWRRGDIEGARDAFLRGGQASMARRMEDELERRGRGSGEYRASLPLPEDEAELVAPAHAKPAQPDTHDGSTPMAEPRQTLMGMEPARASAVEAAREVGERVTAPWPGVSIGHPSAQPHDDHAMPTTPTITDIVTRWTATFPEGSGLAVGPGGELLMQTRSPEQSEGEERGLFARRSVSSAIRGDLRAERVARRAMGEATKETLGGRESPLERWRGDVRAVAHPPEGRRFWAINLEGTLLFVRESLLVAFDATLDHESAALPLGDASGVFTKLQGEGAVALSLDRDPVGVAVADSVVRVHPARLLGWTGRLFPSADGDALAFRGQGVVLVGA